MTNDSLGRIKSDLASLSTQQRAELAQYLIETLDAARLRKLMRKTLGSSR